MAVESRTGSKRPGIVVVDLGETLACFSCDLVLNKDSLSFVSQDAYKRARSYDNDLIVLLIFALVACRAAPPKPLARRRNSCSGGEEMVSYQSSQKELVAIHGIEAFHGNMMVRSRVENFGGPRDHDLTMDLCRYASSGHYSPAAGIKVD